MSISLTESQHADLEEVGFTILPGVFSPAEMDALALRIEALQEKHLADLKEKGGTEGISRADEITFTCHLAQQDPEIMAFCQRPEFIAITTQLLGPDTDLYWNQSVFKMPEGKKEFPWHQDDGYTPVEPSPYLTLWLALNDATVENGCVWVLPGSYKRGLVKHASTPEGWSCHSLDDPNQGIPVPVKAGSIVAFWSLTMHKSSANVSGGPRKAYIIQYSKAGLISLPGREPVPHLLPIARGGAAA
jgi:phytanoyl-CoA hydroxylase